MGTTANRAYRYPAGSDDPGQLAVFVKNLADDVDTDVAAVVADRPKILTGAVSITPTGPSVDTTAAVVFPVGFFTAAPVVLLTANTATPSAIVGLTVSGKSDTGFTIHFLNSTLTTARSIQWFAVGI